MDLYTILIIGHIIGAILGVGGATFIEIHLNMFLKDGEMNDTEKAVMKRDFLLTRIGMGLGLITGLGFVVIYIINGQVFRLMDGVFWSKMVIFLIIVTNAVLLHKHKIGLYWGSAFSFVSWWIVMLLGIFLTQGVKILPANDLLSFIVIMGGYTILVILGAVVLDKIRKSGEKDQPPTTSVPTSSP